MENEILPKRNIPRDLFLHLLAIVTLYWSAISFTTLLWQFINYFFPDALYYYRFLSQLDKIFGFFFDYCFSNFYYCFMVFKQDI